MTSKRLGYSDIVVTAPVTVPYQRNSPHGAHWFLGTALKSLLETSRLPRSEIDGMCVSSFTLAPDSAVGLTQHVGMSPRWLDHIPMGGACGVVALRRAARAVQAGDAQIVACLAGDANRPESFRQLIENFSQFTQDAAFPYGAAGPNAIFALLTSYYMREYGAGREDFGKLCIAQRHNAKANPDALLKKTLTMEDYLGARLVADPLRLFDCVMPCAGAEGFLVMQRHRAESLALPYARILGTIERHNAFPDDVMQTRGGWALDCNALYSQAGVGPHDMDFVQTYDDYPVMNAIQLEDLGFCDKGAGPEFVRTHEFTIEGDFPLNTSGGQLSAGQAGAAGGYLGLVEAIRQLSGLAGARAVRHARLGLVSGFGMVNYDRGLCTGAAVLASAS